MSEERTEMPRVTMMPATLERYTAMPLARARKRRAAAYARVSTDSDEQMTSYEAQVEYYTEYIMSQSEWEFVGVYTDEGITGTNTKKRDGFRQMVQDALDGKINLIVTKSISRFARNTVDTLITVRMLKEKGVEVYFQKENIYTLDSKGEIMITIMSSLAQEESRSISENVTWGKRKKMADGKIYLPYKHFLGYRKGADDVPEIVEDEAAIIRRIYRLFLEGKTPYGITEILMADGIHSPAGKRKWQVGTILSILSNEKYKGDALLQKTFCTDFLTKKVKVNEGEVPQYYVENSHPAIVPAEMFEMVQQELERRKVSGSRQHNGTSCFSGKIVCGCCGGVYGSKVWHSTSKYRRVIWQCNAKFKDGHKCSTPHLSEEQIQYHFLSAYNRLLADRAFIAEDMKAIQRQIADTSGIEAEAEGLREEQVVLDGLMRQAINQNANAAVDQAGYKARYDGLESRYDAASMRLSAIEAECADRKARRHALQAFSRVLMKGEAVVTEFSPELWNAVVDHMTVGENGAVVFTFRNGMGVKSE